MSKTTKKILHAIIIVFCGLVFSQAQDYNFRNLSVAEGLSQSAVICIEQDKTGYLWFGTADGLNRYNGYGFTHFRNRPSEANSLSDNFIRCLDADENGGLWIGTQGGGLNYYNHRTKSFKHYGRKNGLLHNDVYSVLDDGEKLYVGTYNGLHTSIERDSFIYHPLSDSLVYTVYDLIALQNGTKLFAYDWGVGVLNSQTGIVDTPKGDMAIFTKEETTVNSFLQDTKDRIWVGSSAGVWLFDKEFNLLKRFLESSEDGGWLPITDLYEDANGNVWVGTNGKGALLLNAEEGIIQNFTNSVYDKNSLSDNVVTSIYEDRSGVIWLGTYGGGINKYDRYLNQFKLYEYQRNNPKSLSARRVFAIHEQANDDIWVGTDGGGLNLISQIKNDEGELIEEKYSAYVRQKGDNESLSSNKVWAIAKADENHIWVGTIGGGLNLFNLQTKKVEKVYNKSGGTKRALSDDSIYSIFIDSKGLIWLGTDVGLNCLDPETDAVQFFNINPREKRTFSSNTVLALEEDEKGNIWAGTFGGGISVFHPKKGLVQSYRHDVDDTQSLSYDKVMSIYKTQGGDMWVGTFGGGLNHFNAEKKTFSTFNEKDGLPNDVVYGILEQADGSLWLSTNKGLSHFFPTDTSFMNYDASCNLQSDEFNQGAYFKGSSGKFYFGGINGFNVFKPNELISNKYKPPIAITAFEEPGERLKAEFPNSEKTYVLPYKQNNIFFEFVAFNYVNPELNNYRYKLKGLNNEWIDLGAKRSASFTNLDPGEYEFVVQASNNDGIWNRDGASVMVQVTSPIYLKWWFVPLIFGLSFMLIALIAFLGIKNARSKAKQQLIQAELKVSQAEKDSYRHKLTSLRAQMDPHFIFNSLNSIQHFISNNDGNSARTYLSKFSSLMRQILNSSREETVALSEELSMLELYIDLERLRFDNLFDYSIQVEESIDQDEIEIPTLLLQPYIENAIIHGLKNRAEESGGLLEIEICMEGEDQLHVIIKDNGIGRARANEIRKKKLSKYKSLGMKVTQDRLELWTRDSEKPVVEVSDMYNQRREPAGTRVDIRIKVEPYS